MSRNLRGTRRAPWVAAVAMALAVSTPAWTQKLETREGADGWIEVEAAGSQGVRLRIVEIGEREPPSAMILDTGGEYRIETDLDGDDLEQRSIVVELGDCGGTPRVMGVYRHRGESVAVISASWWGSNHRGVEYSSEFFSAIALRPEPEVLFERCLFHGPSDWGVPKPQEYRFVPMFDLLMVVMVGVDGVLPWPVGERPADQSTTIVTTAPNQADAIASMPQDVRSKLAPVGAIPRTNWVILQEPFTEPPRRMVVGGSRYRGGGLFSTELSYDGPRFRLETRRGTDDDRTDPWPAADFPLADYRWKQREFGPQVLDGEVVRIAAGSERELYLLRWPCKLDRSAGEFVDDEELPEWEEWAVLLDLTDPQEAEVQTHLVQTCLAFQVQRFVVGRGALYRTFENGRIERIQENGRTVGLEIHHSRPRILEWPEGGHFPDERSYFEKNFSYATWWQPIFDGPETTEPIVLRVDR